MRVVSRRELKKRARKYLRLALAGETVFVTRRGRIVAQLVPVRADLGSLPTEPVLAAAGPPRWLREPVTIPHERTAKAPELSDVVERAADPGVDVPPPAERDVTAERAGSSPARLGTDLL